MESGREKGQRPQWGRRQGTELERKRGKDGNDSGDSICGARWQYSGMMLQDAVNLPPCSSPNQIGTASGQSLSPLLPPLSADQHRGIEAAAARLPLPRPRYGRQYLRIEPGRQTNTQIDLQTHKHIDATCRHTYAYNQTNSQTDRKTGTHTNRHTDRNTTHTSHITHTHARTHTQMHRRTDAQIHRCRQRNIGRRAAAEERTRSSIAKADVSTGPGQSLLSAEAAAAR